MYKNVPLFIVSNTWMFYCTLWNLVEHQQKHLHLHLLALWKTPLPLLMGWLAPPSLNWPWRWGQCPHSSPTIMPLAPEPDLWPQMLRFCHSWLHFLTHVPADITQSQHDSPIFTSSVYLSKATPAIKFSVHKRMSLPTLGLLISFNPSPVVWQKQAL